MDARFAAIDERLMPERGFRPLLGKRPREGEKANGTATAPTVHLFKETNGEGGKGAPTSGGVRKGAEKTPIQAPKKVAKDGKKASPAQQVQQARPLPLPPKDVETEWTVVVGGKGKKRAEKARRAPTAPSTNTNEKPRRGVGL